MDLYTPHTYKSAAIGGDTETLQYLHDTRHLNAPTYEICSLAAYHSQWSVIELVTTWYTVDELNAHWDKRHNLSKHPYNQAIRALDCNVWTNLMTNGFRMPTSVMTELCKRLAHESHGTEAYHTVWKMVPQALAYIDTFDHDADGLWGSIRDVHRCALCQALLEYKLGYLLDWYIHSAYCRDDELDELSCWTLLDPDKGPPSLDSVPHLTSLDDISLDTTLVSHKADGVRHIVAIDRIGRAWTCAAPTARQRLCNGYIWLDGECVDTPFGKVIYVFDVLKLGKCDRPSTPSLEELVARVPTVTRDWTDWKEWCAPPPPCRIPLVAKPRFTWPEWRVRLRDRFPFASDGWVLSPVQRGHTTYKWKPRVTYDLRLEAIAHDSELGQRVARSHGKLPVDMRRFAVRTEGERGRDRELPNHGFVDLSVDEWGAHKDVRIAELTPVGPLDVDPRCGWTPLCRWHLVKFRPDKRIPNPTELVETMLHTHITEAEVVAHFDKTAPSPTTCATSFVWANVCRHHRQAKAHLYRLQATGRRVLDLCAGRGGDADAWLASGVDTIVAVERDEAAVRTGRERVATKREALLQQYAAGVDRRRPPTVKYVQHDVSEPATQAFLPLGQRFDSVVCHFAIHYLVGDDARREAFFRHVVRDLRPGGTLTVTFLDAQCYDADNGFEYTDDDGTVQFSVKPTGTPATVRVYVSTIGRTHEEAVMTLDDLKRWCEVHDLWYERACPMSALSLHVRPALTDIEHECSNRFTCATFVYRPASLRQCHWARYVHTPALQHTVSSYLETRDLLQLSTVSKDCFEMIVRLPLEREMDRVANPAFDNVHDCDLRRALWWYWLEATTRINTCPNQPLPEWVQQELFPDFPIFVGECKVHKVDTACIHCECTRSTKECDNRVCFYNTCAGLQCELGYRCYKSTVHLPNFNACIHCGCTRSTDELGDRVCFCNTCAVLGCELGYRCYKSTVHKVDNACIHCGCTRSTDELGDRVCFCNTCAGLGCELGYRYHYVLQPSPIVTQCRERVRLLVGIDALRAAICPPARSSSPWDSEDFVLQSASRYYGSDDDNRYDSDQEYFTAYS